MLTFGISMCWKRSSLFSAKSSDVNVSILEDEPESEDTVDFAHWDDEDFDLKLRTLC